MRSRLLTILLLLISFTAFAQIVYSDETADQLYSPKSTSKGGYVSMIIDYTALNYNNSMVLGIRGGQIRNKSYAFGAGLYGFISSGEPNPSLGSVYEYNFSLQGGYGGIFAEKFLHLNPNISLSFPVFLGAGTISYVSETYNEYSWENSGWNDMVEDAGAFFLIEPGAEINFNYLKNMLCTFGISYRFATNVDLTSNHYNTGEIIVLAPKQVMSGLSLGIQIKFGKF